jgi:hypothetical protein
MLKRQFSCCANEKTCKRSAVARSGSFVRAKSEETWRSFLDYDDNRRIHPTNATKIGVCEERETKTRNIYDVSYEKRSRRTFASWLAIPSLSTTTNSPSNSPGHLSNLSSIFSTSSSCRCSNAAGVARRISHESEFLFSSRVRLMAASCEFSSVRNVFSSLPRKASTRRHVKFFRPNIRSE